MPSIAQSRAQHRSTRAPVLARRGVVGLVLLLCVSRLHAQQPSPTGQQRANEALADRAGEFDVDTACKRAHAYYPSPANLRVALNPTAGPAGSVSLQWTAVPGLNDSVTYEVSYVIQGFAGSDRGVAAAFLPHTATSYVVANVPVYYFVRYAVASRKMIKTSMRLPRGPVLSRLVACEETPTMSAPTVLTTSASLRGFADLHTHPLANLGFGGKLLYGGLDSGSLLPADPDCHHNVRAVNEAQALGHDGSVHGGSDLFASIAGKNCGDVIREALIHVLQSPPANNPLGDVGGYPDFVEWPKWNDLTHQKMWVDWIRRAHRGGLRAMVALAVNNKTLGDLTAGPGDYPTDDKTSADLQIDETKQFVARHPDFMEIAYNSADLFRIVSSGKLAVILGVEIDHIGNFGVAQPTINKGYTYPDPPPDPAVRAEIDRLYAEGVRYVFPIHLVDNAFGGTAAYIDLLNASNVRESGHPWNLVCATDRTDVDIRDTTAGGYNYSNGGLGLLNTAVQLGKTGFAVISIATRSCPPGVGQKNRLGLTHSGVVAINQMMRHGMLIDIDHMSQLAADSTLRLAAFAGYPVNSGHNAVRGAMANHTERSLRPDQYLILGRLHGMAGVGSAKMDAPSWVQLYGGVLQAMGGGRIAAGFGTDVNGLEFGMPPSAGARQRVVYTAQFPADVSGTRTFNYADDGVAHYGMLWDFTMDVKALSPGTYENLMTGADYLFHTWQICEGKAPQIM